MVQSREIEGRIAGVLLILGVVIPIGAGVLLVASGADFSKIISSSQRGLEEISNHVSAFHWSNVMGAVGILLTLFGLDILSSLLQDAGDGILPHLAFVAFLVGTIMFVIVEAFHISVTVWAAKETARTAAVPDFYQPLRRWIGTLQAITIRMGTISILGYGASILRTRLLPVWLGLLCAGWGAAWFLWESLPGSGVPVGIVVIMPMVVGIILLVQKRR